jgi:hypothetical protein
LLLKTHVPPSTLARARGRTPVNPKRFSADDVQRVLAAVAPEWDGALASAARATYARSIRRGASVTLTPP